MITPNGAIGKGLGKRFRQERLPLAMAASMSSVRISHLCQLHLPVAPRPNNQTNEN
jgi:hypothetical protein